MSGLIVVESPTKAKTISRFLSGDFVVKSSYGHIRDLPQKSLGIDVAHDFEPKYVIPVKAKQTVAQLKKDAQKADKVILATDEDREGEAIAWHLVKALGLDTIKKQPSFQARVEGKSKIKNVERIVFHEITKSAIEKALENPREIDQDLVDAQQARRVLDRLVGYKLSPFLWRKITRGLSAGRVQSVAVRLIVEREREIEKFKPEEYYTISVILQKSQLLITNYQLPNNGQNPNNQTPDEIIAGLIKINDKALGKLDIKTKDEADKIVNDLNGAAYIVENINKEEVSRSPLPPFITSTLQQDAAKKLGFSAKQTMLVAQQLYEGVELGDEGSVGLITYMRTDSVNLSQESLKKARDYIINAIGNKYFEERAYKTKSKSAQEAHEAIRPTEPDRIPESIKSRLTTQQYKLYNLIWRRFLASQMTKAVFDSTAIDIGAKSYTFRANGQTMKFDGFLKIYPMKFSESDLLVVANGEKLNLKKLNSEQHFTKPPARFNEASLIKLLEKEGIGRPSTYAPIISTIQQRNYAEKDRSKYFHPTEIGTMVNDLLVEHFPSIVDIKFTSKMEDNLDDIALGKVSWVSAIREFYGPFAENLEKKYAEVSKEEVTQAEKTGQKCEKCGSDMVVRMGRYGKFIACSNYPECKNILKEKKEKEPPIETGELCEKCGGKMVIRKGRFGEFAACSNYPKCRNTKKIKKGPAKSDQ